LKNWRVPAFICVTCGVQYAESATPPPRCPICEDERQYVGLEGQQWTTLERLRERHRAVLTDEEPQLTGIGTTPEFAIGQRALLVQTGEGNVLWDCISYLDDSLVAAVRGLGGIAAIAISHPHYYSSMLEWSAAFDGVPVFIHEADREWVQRSDGNVVFWEGDQRKLPGGLTLVHCGGHFAGAQVLHWPEGAAGRGALLTGDIIQVVPDRAFVSFMYSYPNLIPLSAGAVRRIAAAVEGFAFDRLYGAWFGRVVREGAKDAVRRSAERYARAVRGNE
jgi:glyoxylase-like metal-dependent hydrolase (beta-lactamase superfamily II)